tara:strand:- start:1848 stop:2129 length:282 start_codon:yes stop_codon:yes gene_type:complete
MISIEWIWIAIGLVGQMLFSMRFIMQWIASEKQKASTIPISFWYFSIGGGITLLSYAIYRQDPVFIVGQALGIFIYSRNLYFIHSNKSHLSND